MAKSTISTGPFSIANCKRLPGRVTSGAWSWGDAPFRPSVGERSNAAVSWPIADLKFADVTLRKFGSWLGCFDQMNPAMWDIASASQTWQWKISHSRMIFPTQHFHLGIFQPRSWLPEGTRGYPTGRGFSCKKRALESCCAISFEKARRSQKGTQAMDSEAVSNLVCY